MEQMRRLREITGGIGRSFQPLSDGYFGFSARVGLMFPGTFSMDIFISNWIFDLSKILFQESS
jgi:hypothetical protein